MPADLDLGDMGAVTTTGLGGPNLAFRSGALTAGALYRFALTVTGGPQLAFGAVMVQMNRAPWGGGLSASPATGFALVTAFELRAQGWTDEESDLPLSYGFEFERFAGDAAITLADVQVVLALGDVTLVEGAGGSARVRVLDTYGASAFARIPLSVGPPPTLVCAHLVALLEKAELRVLTGASSAAKQRLQALADAYGAQLASCDGGDFNTTATGSNASLPIINRMLAVSADASASAISTQTSRRQSAGVLATVLAHSDTLNGAAQAEGGVQLAALATQSAEGGGADEDTADALVRALGSVLVANSTRASAEQHNATLAAAVATAAGLARALVTGALAGEQVREALDPSVNVSAARTSAASLANSTRATPGGGGSVALPLSTFDGLDTQHVLDGGVDMLMYAFARDVHSDGPAVAAGGRPSDGSLQTGVLSVTLASASGSTVLAISGLTVPILLAIPLAAAATAADPNCTSPYYGPSCNFTTACHYWDTAAQAYLTDGCETVATPIGGDPSLLFCACTHLTDFAGIEVQVPTSAANLVDQVKATNVNTFSLTDARTALSKVDADSIAANPIVYGLVFGIAGACALSLLLFCAKDHREEQHRMERLTNDDSVKAAAIVRSAHVSNALEMPIKDSFKQLLAREEEAATVVRAAVAIQRHLRGRSERKKVRTLMDVARNAKEMLHKGIAAISREIYARVKSDHSLLGLWFGDAKEATRAELAQRFWNTCMFGLVIECMLYSPPSVDPATGTAAPPPSPPAGGVYVQINVVAIVVNSLITGVLMLPALWVFSAIFAWGSGRTSPIAERFAATLLGGEQAEDDAQLANRARPAAYARALDKHPDSFGIKANALGINRLTSYWHSTAAPASKATVADSSSSGFKPTSASGRAASSASDSSATSSAADTFRSQFRLGASASGKSVSPAPTTMADALKSHSRQATEKKEQKASTEASKLRALVDSRLPVDEDRTQWTSADLRSTKVPASEWQARLPTVGSVVSPNGSRFKRVFGAIVVPVATDASLVTPDSICAKLSLRRAGVPVESPRANVAAGTTEPNSNALSRHSSLDGTSVEPDDSHFNSRRSRTSVEIERDDFQPLTSRRSSYGATNATSPGTVSGSRHSSGPSSVEPLNESIDSLFGLQDDSMLGARVGAVDELSLLNGIQDEPSQPPPAGPPEPTPPPPPPKLAPSLSPSQDSSLPSTEQSRRRSSQGDLILGLRRRTNNNPRVSREVATEAKPNGGKVVSAKWSRVLAPVKTLLKLRRRSESQNSSAVRQASARRMSIGSVEYDLDEATVTLLRTTFAKFDKDHSGSVSVKELSGLMTDLGFHLSRRGILKLQRELDTSGEGLVSLQELVLWYNTMVDKAIERERKRKTGWRKHWARAKRACTLPPRVRLVIAWLLMWGLFAVLSMLAVVYSVVFGHETTKLMLFSWSIACAQTFTFEEPIMIAMSILLPWLGEQLTSNVLVGRIVTKFVSPVVSGCYTLAGWFSAAQ
ncbi:hypothetical protein T492DRAFT_959500 [Pavlovales sp. CCMP2436]|nr:hypothetical protein T492DRAFT_959500 [Pavlovales sp. CCMP2436]